jgi:hypothetical protein
MAKKKKTALKPVARGFATTSVPKKVVDIEEPPPEDEASLTAGTSEVEEGSADPGAQSAKAPEAEEWDPEKVEEQSLQNLVDKLQEKTEKDVVRMVKVGICVFLVCAVSLNIVCRRWRPTGDSLRPCRFSTWIRRWLIGSSLWSRTVLQRTVRDSDSS